MLPKTSRRLAIAMLGGAVVSTFIGLFYATVDTNFLASDFGRHIKHSVAFEALALVLIFGSVVLIWRRRGSASAPKSPPAA
jgi:hypothetical protein